MGFLIDLFCGREPERKEDGSVICWLDRNGGHHGSTRGRDIENKRIRREKLRQMTRDRAISYFTFQVRDKSRKVINPMTQEFDMVYEVDLPCRETARLAEDCVDMLYDNPGLARAIADSLEEEEGAEKC